jgi:hypothetical protein
MQSLQDTIYNWLTIKVVCDARPDDTAARDTKVLFDKLLEDDQVEILAVTKEEPFYFVEYHVNQEQKTQRYPIELIDVMIDQIQAEPDKYQNYQD